MTDFTPTPEAKARVEQAIAKNRGALWHEAECAIAAFVEAEGLTEERRYRQPYEDAPAMRVRHCTPWRKRHASPDATQ